MTATERIGAIARTGASTALGYWRGFTYPFRGAKFVYRDHPALVRIWIWPIAITFAAFVTVMWAVWSHSDALTALVWSSPTGGGFWADVGRVVHSIVEFLLGLLLTVGGLVGVTLLSPIFAAPFNDLLSEEVERLATGRAAPSFSVGLFARGLVRTVLLEIGKLLLYLSVMLPLFVVSLLVPVVGQVVYTVFGFLFTATYWSIDYVDWPASRRDRGIRYRIGLFRRFKLPMLGFGSGVWLFLMIPFVNLFFMPAAVAGGTLLYLDLDGERAEV